MSSLADFLRSLPYFTSLDVSEIKRIENQVLERSFAKGEILFLDGEPCDGVYVVKSGWVRVYKSSPGGREQVLLIARPGDSFNDVPVFDGGPNPASASALKPSAVYIIPKETVLSLVADSPAALAIIKLLSTRLRHLTMVVEGLSFRSIVSRLARVLLDLAVVEEKPTPIPRLTQDEMAAMVGSVRDVIGRALKVLEKTGAIRIEGQRIFVEDPEKLRDMS